eukprot:m.4589 g.4589  ORF g.4589 m.4589 type:complete len:215 (+) comp3024_c0_seq1:97-741(+)
MARPQVQVQIPEDVYRMSAPQNDLLRYWLSFPISRSAAEASLQTPSMAHPGSYIVRRSESMPGNYAITVAEGKFVNSYKITDLGLGQVGVSSGQAFASLEHLLEFYYDKPFPDSSPGRVPLQWMHQGDIPGAPKPPPKPMFEDDSTDQSYHRMGLTNYEDADVDDDITYDAAEDEEGVYGDFDDDGPPSLPPGRAPALPPGRENAPPLPPSRPY